MYISNRTRSPDWWCEIDGGKFSEMLSGYLDGVSHIGTPCCFPNNLWFLLKGKSTKPLAMCVSHVCSLENEK